MMGRIEPAERGSAQARRGRRLLAAAGAVVAFAAAPALAQETGGLRGGLSVGTGGDSPTLSPRRSAAEPAGTEDEDSGAPAYVPLSVGALPAEPDGIAGVAAESPFTDDSPPVSRTAPSDDRGSDEQPLADGAGTMGTVPERPAERAAAAERLNRRAEAIEGRDRATEEDPYAPLGLRLGTFTVLPSLEQGLAWTSNASSSPGGASAVLSETTLRLDAISDWSRHSAAFSAYGIFRKSLSGEEIKDPEAGLDADLVLELGDSLRGTASAGYNLRPESAASPVDLPPTTSRPLRQTLTASLGLEKTAGKLLFGLTGNIERQRYGDAELAGGGELSQRERDFLLSTAMLRLGYEISPALTPFMEAELGRRAYDLAVDSNGYDRSALRTGARAGLAFDLGEKLFGEVSAGWLHEDLDDARLSSISAASVEADLYWSPERGTLVGLQAATSVEGATAPDESGSVLYTSRLSVERRMRANLTGNAALGADFRGYAGSGSYDLTLSAQAGLTYWFNRYAGLTGRARHETVKSDEPGREAETNSIFLGLRLQR
jgi:hypothetical protein